MNYDISPQIHGDTWQGIPAITFSKNNSAIDLTDAEVTFKVSKSFNVAAPSVLTLTVKNSGIVIFDPVQGKLTIPPRIIEIPVGRYQWSLTLKLNNKEVKTYILGNWTIIPKIPLDINQNVYDHYPIVQ